MSILDKISELQLRSQTPAVNIFQCVELELVIHRIALEILNLPEEQQPPLKEALERARSFTIFNQDQTQLHLNLIQNLAPTPLCPFYNKLRLPTFSNYGVIAANITSIRLDPSAIRFVPRAVLDAAGTLSEKEVDLFLTVTEGPVENLCTHPWAHPYALPGDDVTTDIPMGIFPEWGFSRAQAGAPVAVNGIAPMRVHSHHGLYSPNNAHLQFHGSPCGTTWAVTAHTHRIALTKMVALPPGRETEHPIATALREARRGCRHLSDYLAKLENVRGAIDETLKPLVDAITSQDVPDLNLLPTSIQHLIFKHTWTLHGEPRDIHCDFGRASFLRDPSLDPAHYSNEEQRLNAIFSAAEELKALLVDSQIDLLLHSQPLVRSDRALALMQCAREPNDLSMLSQEERNAVYGATWNLAGCPRGNLHFGEETFHAWPQEQKAEALLLAASKLR
ncbi:MAG: hypothetical protein JSS61_06810 [Verrucomicrobia bacterium]|nr:hypothetical protein [Verrucomicrobiota bacterium]